MTITTNPVRNEYTATASQTVFNYTFRIYNEDEISVYITPAGQDADDAADIISAYTVTGVNDVNGGTIVLDSGATAGDLVTIVSSIPEDRETDYVNNGDFLPETVNADIDRTVSLVKQKISRGAFFPDSAQGIVQGLFPTPVNNKLLAWDGNYGKIKNKDVIAGSGIAVSDNGTDIAISAIGDSTGFDGNVYTNLAVALAADGDIGDVVRTGEYYASTGKGAATYRVVSSAPFYLGTVNHAKTDGSGYYLELVEDQSINIYKGGAVGDGATDDTTSIQDCVDFAIDNGIGVFYPAAIFLHDEITASNAAGLSIEGVNATSLGSSSYGGGYAFSFTDCQRITIKGINFDRQNSYSSGNNVNGVGFFGCDECMVTECSFPDTLIANVIDESATQGSTRCKIINNSAPAGRLPYTAANDTNKLLNLTFVVVGANGNTFYCEDNLIANNVMETCRIALTNYCYGTSVNNNICHNSIDSSIYFSNQSIRNSAVGNVIINAGKDGIKAINDSIDTTVVGNTIYGAGIVKNDGINCIIIGDDVGSGRAVVTGNFCRLKENSNSLPGGSNNGIHVAGGTDVTISGNMIYSTDSESPDIGIQISGQATHVVVDGNNINAIDGFGMRITPTGGLVMEDLSITNNYIEGKDNTSSQYGISIDTAVSGGGTVDRVKIEGNKIRTWNLGGIELDGSEYIQIDNNDFTDIASTAQLVRTANSPQNVSIGKNTSDGNELAFFAAGVSIIPNTTSLTASDTLTNGYGFETYDNTGAAGSITITLPRAYTGMKFAFSRAAAQNIVLDGASTEQIESGVGTGVYANNQTLTTADAVVVIECIVKGRWQVSAGGY